MLALSFLVGVLLLGLAYLGLRWFAEAEPRQLIVAGKWTAGVIGGGVAAWLLVSGRLGTALTLIGALAPMLVRWKGLWTRVKNASGPAAGGQSNIETAWLRMSLDHDSGAMEGVVLRGPLRGRPLSALDLDALRDLLAECRVDDPDGAVLLESYLDRAHPAWRGAEDAASAAGPSAAPSAAMTRDEAWRVLGLEPGADPAAIRRAHRELMKKLHPDHGGSVYLAAKINQAKDLLLS